MVIKFWNDILYSSPTHCTPRGNDYKVTEVFVATNLQVVYCCLFYLSLGPSSIVVLLSGAIIHDGVVMLLGEDFLLRWLNSLHGLRLFFRLVELVELF